MYIHIDKINVQIHNIYKMHMCILYLHITSYNIEHHRTIKYIPTCGGQQLFRAPCALTLSDHVWKSAWESAVRGSFLDATSKANNSASPERLICSYGEWQLTYWRPLTYLKINACYNSQPRNTSKKNKHVWRPCPVLCQPWIDAVVNPWAVWEYQGNSKATYHLFEGDPW